MHRSMHNFDITVLLVLVFKNYLYYNEGSLAINILIDIMSNLNNNLYIFLKIN